MLIPVRCFSCGKVVGNKMKSWASLTAGPEGKTPREALDLLGLTRFCCRRMILTHVDVCDDITRFTPDEIMEDSSTMLTSAVNDSIPASSSSSSSSSSNRSIRSSRSLNA